MVWLFNYNALVFIILIIIMIIILPIFYANCRDYRGPILVIGVFLIIVIPIILITCCDIIYFQPPIRGGSPFAQGTENKKPTIATTCIAEPCTMDETSALSKTTEENYCKIALSGK